jgi:hypothetical protein
MRRYFADTSALLVWSTVAAAQEANVNDARGWGPSHAWGILALARRREPCLESQKIGVAIADTG